MCVSIVSSLGKKMEDVLYVQDQLEIINGYYENYQVNTQSCGAPLGAYFKCPTASEGSGVEQPNRSIGSTTDRKRKRKRDKQLQKIGHLIEKGKYVPVDPSLLERLKEAHRKTIEKYGGMSRTTTASGGLLPRVAKEGVVVNLIDLQSDAMYDRWYNCFHENEEDQEKEVSFGPSGYSCIIPRNSKFFMGDVFAGCNSLVQSERKFDLITMDPPWNNKSVHRGKKYPTMHYSELAKLCLPLLMHPQGCVVGIWITNNPTYIEYVRNHLLAKWSCHYIGTWYWIKIAQNGEPVTPFESTHKLPYEQLIVAHYTDPKCHDPKTFVEPFKKHASKILTSMPLRHSWKPVLDPLFEEMSPVVPFQSKLELFARELRPHWTSIGKEVLKFQDTSLYT